VSDEYHKCDREKGFCPTMAARAEPVGQGARHGLIQMAVMDFSAKPITTRGIGIMFKMNAKDKGIMLNYCPWCGGRLHE